MIKIKQAQPKNIDPKQNQKISTIQVNKKDVDEDGDDDGLVQTNKTKKDKKQQFQAPVAIPQQEQLDDKPINLENFGPNQQKSQAKPQVVNEGYTVNKAEFPTLETADQEKISKKKQKELIEANKLKDQQQEQAILTNNGASLFTNSRQGNQPFQQPQQNTNKLNFSTPIQFSNPKKQELEKIFEQKKNEIVTQQIQRSTVPIAKEETPTPAPIIQFTKSQINLAEKNGAPQQAQPAQPAQPTQPKIQRSSITREQMMEQEKLQKQQEQPKPVIQFTNSGKKVQEVQPQNKVEDDDDGWITVEAPGKR
ncbi:hypothetical protein pb186bvf_016596 [Paramecium bursaria]